MSAPLAPVVGVGAVVRRGDAVLLVKRGTPPSAGEWAIPGGRVALGETLARAAEREILEETGIRVAAGDVVFSFEYIERQGDAVAHHFVVLDLAATYLGGEPRAGDDASEAAWVRLAEIDRLPLNATTRRALTQLFPGEMP